jgi:hypothetical protein
MKKLLSVFLVLALCGMASAAVSMYITDSAGNDEITLEESQSIDLYLWYTGDNIISFNTIIQATGPGTLSATVGNASDWDPPVAMPNITATGRAIWADGVALAIDWSNPEEYPDGQLIPNAYKVTGSADSGALGQGNPVALAFVTIHCDGPGDVLVALTNVGCFLSSPAWDEVVPVLHNMTIHQIPEPATIALLCLGGLLLRKKK